MNEGIDSSLRMVFASEHFFDATELELRVYPIKPFSYILIIQYPGGGWCITVLVPIVLLSLIIDTKFQDISIIHFRSSSWAMTKG